MNTDVIVQENSGTIDEYRYKHFTTALLMHDARGIAAASVLALGMLVMIGLVATWASG